MPRCKVGSCLPDRLCACTQCMGVRREPGTPRDPRVARCAAFAQIKLTLTTTRAHSARLWPAPRAFARGLVSTQLAQLVGASYIYRTRCTAWHARLRSLSGYTSRSTKPCPGRQFGTMVEEWSPKKAVPPSTKPAALCTRGAGPGTPTLNGRPPSRRNVMISHNCSRP